MEVNLETVSQSAHTLAGALSVLGSVAIFGPRALWWGAGSIVVFAAIKEFWYDQNYESPDVRGSNLRDFAYYVFGTALSVFVYYLTAGLR